VSWTRGEGATRRGARGGGRQVIIGARGRARGVARRGAHRDGRGALQREVIQVHPAALHRGRKGALESGVKRQARAPSITSLRAGFLSCPVGRGIKFEP
jgi:hypothetical protein